MTIVRGAIAAFSLIVLLAACGEQGPKFKSTDITGAPYGKALALTDHFGKRRTLADFRGKAVVLFFGFTQCPDVCPTTLADAAEALKTLGTASERVQVLFVTLDPERDTREILSSYVTAFDPRFLALSGDLDATQVAAKEFKVFFEKRPADATGAYSVDHSAQTYVLDPAGRLRLFVRHGRLREDLAHDLRALFAETG